jgi:hypothetical protein
MDTSSKAQEQKVQAEGSDSQNFRLDLLSQKELDYGTEELF